MQSLLTSARPTRSAGTSQDARSRRRYRSLGRHLGPAEVGMGPEDLLPPARAAIFPPLYERVLSEGPFRVEDALLDDRILEIGQRYVGLTYGKERYINDLHEVAVGFIDLSIE